MTSEPLEVIEPGWLYLREEVMAGIPSYTTSGGIRFRQIIPPYCPYCHHPLDPVEHYRMCWTCNTLTRNFIPTLSYDRARSATLYTTNPRNSEARFIIDAKVDRSKCLILAELMAYVFETYLPEFQLAEQVVPVPMAPMKLRERGFNHAAVLGQELARRLNRPFNDVLVVVREPLESQHDVNGLAARLANVRGCYAVRGDCTTVKAARILLVDNLYTTGGTIIECSRMLKEAGARAVFAFTAGRKLWEPANKFCGGYLYDQ